MRRFVVLFMMATAAAVAGSLGFLDAQSDAEHPFSTEWCSSPIVIPLANADANATSAAPGVVTARGAAPVISSRGPVVRMEEVGSRVQVTFGQTLFHTQWLFGSVDEGDSIRTDAFIGSASQPIDAASARGSLMVSADQSNVGFTAVSRVEPRSTGQIDVFEGATEILFTNEGSTPVDLIAAIGCPALEVDARMISAPAWDAETQRFIAEHEISFRNRLVNARTNAMTTQYGGAASTDIDDLAVNLSIAAPGFSSAEVTDLRLSRELDRRQNVNFDGALDTGLLETPLRLRDSAEHRVRFTVSYEPDFNDSSWNDGVSVPAPELTLRGRVDEIQVGVTARSLSEGVEVDASTSPDRLQTPEPGVVVDHTATTEARSFPDGTIEMFETIDITNTGDTALEELVVRYAVADMYGPGTVLTQINGLASGDCAGSFSPDFDGSQRAVVVYDSAGLDVGGSCSVDLRLRVLPGIVPTPAGETYEAPVVATARSGVREVRDAVAAETTLQQDARLQIELAETEVTNLEDGRYRFAGQMSFENAGDQNLSGVAGRIDLLTSGQDTAPSVVFESISGDDRCAGLGVPARSTSGAAVMAAVDLAPSQHCVVDFSVIAWPGPVLEGWELQASAEALSSRGLTLDVNQASDGFDLTEEPAVSSSTTVDSIVNNADGSYRVNIVTEVTNTGDTPLVSVTATDTGDRVFGDSVIVAERVGDDCAFVAPDAPLRAASQPEGPYSCSVTEQYVVAPGAKLDDWMIESSVEARSPSTASVSAESALAEAIEFTEAPALSSSVALTAIEKIDDRSVRLVLLNNLKNTGDIELRRVQSELDLDAALNGASYTIEVIGADGVIAATSFNGRTQMRLLEGNDELAAGASAAIRVVVVAQTGADSGPFTFMATTTSTSPSTAAVDVETNAIERAVPIVQVIDRALTSTNNNDGTYELTHTVTARNVGKASVPAIAVSTDFEFVFGEFVIGDIETTNTCGSPVAAGAACDSVRTATVRPGSAVGPYSVAVNISAQDDSDLVALVQPEPQGVLYDVRANSPLRFQERPSIDVETSVEDPVNNGDGTYAVNYQSVVTNTGDVPLYRVGVSDFADEYGEAVGGNILVNDSCLLVSFAEPLGPEQQCERSQTITVRPGARLGPWVAGTRVSGDSPTFATVLEDRNFEQVTFEETVDLKADSSLSVARNNGDGTYNATYNLEVTNTGDVPLVEVLVPNVGAGLGSIALGQETDVDSCAGVSGQFPLAPGASCQVEVSQRVQPGAQLGPYELNTEVTGRSPSTEAVTTETVTNELTFSESPKVTLSSQVASVESVDADTFRVVTNLLVENTGNVRVDDLSVSVDLDELFPDSTYRIDGVISNDFVVNEAFTAEESNELIEGGQALWLGTEGTITLILSVEPKEESGPFVGELRIEGTSPAGADVSTVIAAQVDLPSISVNVVAQQSDNNRDGSYTVTTSYELHNDGSTPLEFVRLTEDLAAIYGGTNVFTDAIESDDLPVADLTDRRRGVDLLDWGATLPPGDTAIVTTTVLVEPGNVLGPFVPVVDTTAVSPAGTPVSASGFAPEEIEFVEQPALRVEQRLLNRPAWNPSGSFDVSFAIDVTNDGDVELRSLQVREDLLNALGWGSEIGVRDIRSDTLAVNSDFDGLGQPPRTVESAVEGGDPEASTVAQAEPVERDVGDTRLLRGWDTLPAGETATIELDLRLSPQERGVYSSRVVVSALTPAGTGLGSSGDVIEANTLTRLSVQGELGVAKQTIGEPAVRADGSIAVTYEILVENAGPFPLTNVAVHDQLSQAFGVGSTFVTSRVRIEAASPCEGQASSSYDGGTIDPVLVSGVELNPGEQCRIQYDAVVIPAKALPGPFRSSAFAIGSDPFSGTVIDDSTDGTNPDPDGNQEPGDNDIATSVRVEVPEPSLTLAAEPLDASPRDVDGWYEFGYGITVTNTGAIDVETTRLLASIDDEWSVPYRVISIESDDLVVDDSFDGDNNSSLLERRNRLRAGESAYIVVRMRAAEPRSGELSLPLTFQAESVTGTPIAVDLAEPVTALPAGGSVTQSWLDTLTTEEKRLVALGAAAIFLFVALFVRRVYVRVKRARRVRAAKRAEAAAKEELFLDLNELAESGRMRAHPPELDLTVDEDSGEEVIVEHYSPRRRRGRRPVDRELER